MALAWMGAAGDAGAQGLGLSWDACGAGLGNQTFACDTNAGEATIVVYITPVSDVPRVVQAQVRMYVCFENLALPDWWNVLGPAACRPGALTATLQTSGLSCASAWDPAGEPTARITQRPVTTLNGFEFLLYATLADSTRALNLVTGQPYELVRVTFDHSRTIGPGACSGCSIGANIAAYAAWLYTADGEIINVGDAPSITWQTPSTSCRAITPVRNITWSALKAIYR